MCDRQSRGNGLYKIGVDVGGTNTDAVIFCEGRLLAAVKGPTTSDLEDGIIRSISAVMAEAGITAEKIGAVMIGTTQFTNAFVAAERLEPVGIMRLCLPATTAIPPLYDWPTMLRSKVYCDSVFLPGGNEFDGRSISEFDDEAVMIAARHFRDQGILAIAIAGPFSPVTDAMERRAAAIVRREHPRSRITISSTFARMGLIERENAAAMNASLSTMAGTVVDAFQTALLELEIGAPFFITQNDGTLMGAKQVRETPVLTFASGPTNSMRGAAYLTGVDNAIVVDIGGTTSDFGCLVDRFPRESSVAVDIGGVRTNFRTPDILSLPLGGGTLVSVDAGTGIKIGPKSVGNHLTAEALVFGGRQLTTTDVAVAAGVADIGDSSKVAKLDPKLVHDVTTAFYQILEDGIERMKTCPGDPELILVGGGAALIDQTRLSSGRIHIPEYAGVANAIGAVMAQVGGEVDTIFDYCSISRDQALARARSEAMDRAVAAGADRGTLNLVELEEIALSYLPGDRFRVRAKFVGDLQVAPRNGAV